MTTTDRDLTVQIARVLNAEGWTFEGVHEPGEYDECDECRSAVAPVAAAVLPIVKAEAARALRGAALDLSFIEIEDDYERTDYSTARDYYEDMAQDWLRGRAVQIEKEPTR